MNRARTVRVRIAVAVATDGEWYADGSCGDPDEIMSQHATVMLSPPQRHGVRVSWVEADVPMPEADAIEGEVKP